MIFSSKNGFPLPWMSKVDVKLMTFRIFQNSSPQVRFWSDFCFICLMKSEFRKFCSKITKTSCFEQLVGQKRSERAGYTNFIARKGQDYGKYEVRITKGWNGNTEYWLSIFLRWKGIKHRFKYVLGDCFEVVLPE